MSIAMVTIPRRHMARERCEGHQSKFISSTDLSRVGMSAVCLHSRKNNVSVGKYVHQWAEGWSITSDFTIEFLVTCSDEDVCDVVLPGALGAFVYPRDARFHLHNRVPTRSNDLDDEIRRQRTSFRPTDTTRMQHFSVHEVEHVDDDEEEDEEDEENEDDDNEDDSPDATIEEPCDDSDDDQTGVVE